MDTLEVMVSKGVRAKCHWGSDSGKFARRIPTLLLASLLASFVLMTSVLLDSAQAGGLYVSEFSTGFSLGFGNVHFDSSTGSNGGNQAGIAPIASFSYVHKVSDRVRLGLSFYSISGSILDPNNNWSGRFQVTELSLLTISITPTIAVRVTDWLSIGGGPLVSYGVLN